MLENRGLFTLIFIGVLTLIFDSIQAVLTLNKDANNQFYYTVNGHDIPIDLDIGSEIAGVQERIMFPRDVKNNNEYKKLAPIVNVSEDLGWRHQPMKRSAKHNPTREDIENNEHQAEQDIQKSAGNNVGYDYPEDDSVDNEDVYEDESSNETGEAEGSELVSTRASVSGQSRHRFGGNGNQKERNRHHQNADEYYEEYEDVSSNRKPNRISKPRNTRYDVIRRFIREFLNLQGPEEIRTILGVIEQDIERVFAEKD